MYKKVAAGCAVLAVGMTLLGGCKKEAPEKTEAPQTAPAAPTMEPAPAQAKTGEELFKQHCAVCHPDGGNIINAKKPLNRKALAANNITKPEDIVKNMRNPGPGMNKFDEATVSDKDATAIAEYVLNTFK
jgi:mono/diheme cytochrome c family protein